MFPSFLIIFVFLSHVHSPCWFHCWCCSSTRIWHLIGATKMHAPPAALIPTIGLVFFLNIWVFSIPPRPLMVKLMINPSINQVMVNLFTINLVKTQLDGVFPSTLQSLQVDRHRRQVEFSISIIEVHPLGRSAVLRWAEEQSLVALKWPRKNGGLSHLKWRFFNHGVQNGIEWFISGEFWWYLIFWFLFSIHIFFDICLVSFSQRKWENDP